MASDYLHATCHTIRRCRQYDHTKNILLTINKLTNQKK